MGLLIDGVWTTGDGKWASRDGRFRRSESQFRNSIGSDEFPAETDRYHLYVCLACPWAHRTLIFRKLKGLENIIPVTIVHPHMLENGWEYKPEPEPLYGFRYHHELYTRADAHYSGRVTVPVLWDKQEEMIVCNESAEIIRMFNSAFNELTGNTDDYYPSERRNEIDEINTFVYDNVNNGVYKCGFATKQKVYEKAYDALFTALIRFDAVYYGHFKCNRNRICDMPNLWGYLRDLYQQPGLAETVNMAHIKQHYYYSHESINPTRIVPKGPELDFSAPHDRDRF